MLTSSSAWSNLCSIYPGIPRKRRCSVTLSVRCFVAPQSHHSSSTRNLNGDPGGIRNTEDLCSVMSSFCLSVSMTSSPLQGPILWRHIVSGGLDPPAQRRGTPALPMPSYGKAGGSYGMGLALPHLFMAIVTWRPLLFVMAWVASWQHGGLTFGQLTCLVAKELCEGFETNNKHTARRLLA